MIRTELCDLIGIRYPIIQAGMGPYSTNRLAAAAANAGALGIISTSALVLGGAGTTFNRSGYRWGERDDIRGVKESPLSG